MEETFQVASDFVVVEFVIFSGLWWVNTVGRWNICKEFKKQVSAKKNKKLLFKTEFSKF